MPNLSPPLRSEATAVCESEEAYIVSNERASTVIVATAVNFLDSPEPNI